MKCRRVHESYPERFLGMNQPQMKNGVLGELL